MTGPTRPDVPVRIWSPPMDPETSVAPAPGRRQGRPRDPAVDEAIIAAVYDLIAENGFAGFTVEAVAARAGVGKATIYRRWPTREELVVAAAERILVDEEPPDTGTLRGDLIEWYWQRHRTGNRGGQGRLVGQVIIEAAVNPDLKRWLQSFHQGRRDAVSTMVDRARERGECGPVDPGMVLHLISGALIHRSLFGGTARLRRVDVERYVDAVLDGQPVTDTVHDPG